MLTHLNHFFKPVNFRMLCPWASPLSPISMAMAVSFLDSFNYNICRTIVGTQLIVGLQFRKGEEYPLI
jgi:hypothetical protein